MSSLTQLAMHYSDSANPATRLAAGNIYQLYERYFKPLHEGPITLLELGVNRGESLKIWSAYFPRGIVVGVDLHHPGTDFSAHPNVRFELADQRDDKRLDEICQQHAPSGFDIIIDDASHFGTFTLMSYRALFQHLKPGGLYCVEDWATGYWADWPDGSSFKPFTPQPPSDQIEKQIPTHDYGMTGFVKYLVDEVMSRGIRDSLMAPLTRPDRLEFMHVYKQAVIAQKAVSTPAS